MPIRSKIDKLCLIFYCHRFGLVCTRVRIPQITHSFQRMRTCSIHFTTVSTNATPENMKYHVCQSDRVCQMSLRFFEIRFFFSLDAQSVSRCDADFFLSVCSVCLGQTSRNFIGAAPSFLVNMSHSYQLRRLSANSLLPHIFALSFRLNCR